MSEREVLKAEAEKRRADRQAKRERIERWLVANPGETDAVCAAALGATRTEVGRVRRSMRGVAA